jgi:hypothetical protein
VGLFRSCNGGERGFVSFVEVAVELIKLPNGSLYEVFHCTSSLVMYSSGSALQLKPLSVHFGDELMEKETSSAFLAWCC